MHTYKLEQQFSLLNGAHSPDLIKKEFLSDIFANTVEVHGHKPALIKGNISLTYAEVDRLSNRIANGLFAAGVRPGDVVGLWLPRGLELLIAQLGITKAGASWLPFDICTPLQRLHFCLVETQAKGVITIGESLVEAQQQGLNTYDYLILERATDASVSALHNTLLSRDTTAYIIYTSGSTGLPKGVPISHKQICHFLRSENQILKIHHDDKVYQGFSLAFDFSMEEIWISYLAGAALWIAPQDVVNDFDAIDAALREQQITVMHTVPTLAALLNPQQPTLRLLNLGGEACTADIVAQWSRPGRRILNTYGPTEATVTASLAELNITQQITAGRPLPNYTIAVVDEELNLCPRGVVGELCIAGIGVAAGYINRQELTAKKFVPNPFSQHDHDTILYRSGDLASITPNGLIEITGRRDDQVKIRGYRVELGEIEQKIKALPPVCTAAVVLRTDHGIEQLVAFAILKDGQTWHESNIRKALSTELPSYMIPNRFEICAELPRLTSGKLDRKALLKLPLSNRVVMGAEQQDYNDVEQAIIDSAKYVFNREDIQLNDDIFSDLGGHSLIVARFVSRIRTDTTYSALTLRDVYQHRTFAALAKILSERQAVRDDTRSEKALLLAPIWRRMTCGLAQAICLPLILAIKVAQWFLPYLVFYHLYQQTHASFLQICTITLLTFIGLNAAKFLLPIAMKWLVMGKMKPGRYPLWGWMFFRWWLTSAFLRLAPTDWLAGSPLYPHYLRALGAKVERDVLIDSVRFQAADLLTIGANTSISSEAMIENVRVEANELVIGLVQIGANCYIGSRAVLEENTVMGDGACLGDMSSLLSGKSMPAWEKWEGSPARKVGLVDEKVLPAVSPLSWRRKMSEHLCYALTILTLPVLFVVVMLPGVMVLNHLSLLYSSGAWDASYLHFLSHDFYLLQLLIPISFFSFLSAAGLAVLLKKIALPQIQVGTFSIHSQLYYRSWVVNFIIIISHELLHGLYASIFTPIWLRCMGAKIGREAEVSTLSNFIPNLISLGQETFVADGAMLDNYHVQSGWVTFAPIVMEKRSFVGNVSYIPQGTIVPERVLIGVLSTTPTTKMMSAGDTWFGNPAICLTQRENVTAFPSRLTYAPGIAQKIGRGFIELCRMILPMLFITCASYLMIEILDERLQAHHWGQLVLIFLCAILCLSLSAFLAVVALKWLFIGKYKPRIIPMWTPFVWLSEAVTNLYESLAVAFLLESLCGTPFLPWALRLLGCRIGKGVYMNTTDVTEFDCVVIDDGAVLNHHSGPQTHLFEDRIMKIGEVNIGAGATIGSASILLYGSQIGAGTKIDPLSLVMKGEHIPAHQSWGGSPAELNQKVHQELAEPSVMLSVS